MKSNCAILDAISENQPRIIDDTRARKLAADLKKCAYYETCATYGLNVERVFQDGEEDKDFFVSVFITNFVFSACQKITSRNIPRSVTPTSHFVRSSYPSGYLPSPTGNGYLMNSQGSPSGNNGGSNITLSSYKVRQ